MIRSICMTLTLFCIAAPAWAQFHLGGGLDYMNWTEDTSPEVTESGPLLVLSAGWTQRRERGALFAWRGTLYGGAVDYDGATLFPPSQPIQGTTHYTGTTQEAQFRYRLPGRGDAWFDLVASGGLDAWERRLSSFQRETYFVGFVRLGVEFDRADRGFIAGGGLKLPFQVQEKAYLDGMVPDPLELRPGSEPSVYASVGYQFDPHWRLIGTFDGFRFGESPAETAFVPGFGAGQFYQPASTLYRVGVRVEYVFR